VFKKVLILSVSAGAGHLRAAEALERAFRLTNPALEVRHVDTLQYTNKIFRHLYSKAYIEMVNKMPDVLGWLYDHLDKPWKNERRRLALDKLNTRPFIKMLKEYQPDITVCTHFLPAEIISWLKAKERISCRQSIVVTDFDVHAMWLCHHYEHYFVALDETRLHLEKLGIPADKISVSGIPIDPVFAEQKDRREMRARHGLKQDVMTILLSAGGFGVGPMENILKSLIDDLRNPAEVVALCGRNQKLKHRIDHLAASLSPDRQFSI
jgi:processive 1,2-diacylglycerol beta-glucosyltransferase